MPKLACLYSGRSITFWMADANAAFCCCPDTAVASATLKQTAIATALNQFLLPLILMTRFIPLGLRLFLGDVQFLKRDIFNGVFAPVLVVKMPPLGLKNRKALGFHGPA